MDPVFIAAMGSMLNTLSGQTSLEGQQQELAGRTQAAADAASQAGQRYQQAAQTPVPQVNPLQQSLESSLGNAASVLSHNPGYAQNARDRLQAQQQQLVQARIDNLTSLRDTYDQKARAAEQLGNTEMAGELRLKQEQLGKTLQALYDIQHQGLIEERQTGVQQLKGQQQQGQIAARGAQQRETNAALEAGKNYRAGLTATGGLGLQAAEPGNIPQALQGLITTTRGGQKVLDMSKVPPKQRGMANAVAAANGLIVAGPQEMQALQNIQSTRLTMDKVFNQVQDLLPKDWQDRIQQTPGITMAQLLQTDPVRGAFRAWREQAIKQVRAVAGPGSNYRLTQAQIELAIKNDIPQLNDTWDTARQRLKNLSDMLDSSEEPILSRDWRQLSANVPRGTAAESTGKAAAIAAIRKQDWDQARRVIHANPTLDADPDINRMLDQ
jgi:hypothetical protein